MRWIIKRKQRPYISPARFLEVHGQDSLVSLGCGSLLNHLDKHLKLFHFLGLRYHVGIDREWEISADWSCLFAHPTEHPLPQAFKIRQPPSSMRLFPQTQIEELYGVHCATVVCQRVLSFRHWEEIILSMSPRLVLQEDMHGCELRHPARGSYRKWKKGGRELGLVPFRPWRILPGERNLILWHGTF